MAGKSDLIQVRLKLLGGKEVTAGADKASRAVERVGKSTHKASVKSKVAHRATSGLTRSYKELGHAAKWGLGFLGVGGVLAIESSIHATEELAKTTTGLSRNMGLSTEAASRWGAIAQAREIDSKSLGQAMGTLSKHFVEAARKGGSALTPFHQLGISQEELTKGAHNQAEAIGIAAKAFGAAEGGPKRQAAAMALFGKGWTTVLPLMSEGTKGMQEQLHWADEYGVTLNGHTNEAIMEMVQAQRENKVAMLGLQISLTKALMPAIHAGDEQLQEFIKTLNSPDLTAEQKIERIQHQFEGIESTLIHVLERALPHIAEQGGHLGIALAGAVWHGFQNSNLQGKAAIAGWIFMQFGGGAVLKAGALRVGGMIGTEMGLGLATGAVGAFVAYEIWEHMDARTKRGVEEWAYNAAADFSNIFIRIVNQEIERVNERLNQLNPLGNLGPLSVHAPQIGTIPEVEGVNTNPVPGAHGTAPGKGNWTPHGNHSNAAKRRAYEELWGVPPPAGPPPWPPPKSQRHHHPRPRTAITPRSGGGSQPQALQSAPRLLPHGGGKEVRQPIQLVVDGKVIAELVTKHSLDAAALA